MAACYSLSSSPLSLFKPTKMLISSSSSSSYSYYSSQKLIFQLNNRFFTTTKQKYPSRLSVSCLRQPKVAVVTRKSWDNLIIKSDTPVLVEFYASWCGPCQMVHRVIDELAMEYADRLKCFVLQADEDSSIAEEYDINAVPVVLLFKDGKKCDSVVGTMPKEFYLSAIERVLSS